MKTLHIILIILGTVLLTVGITTAIVMAFTGDKKDASSTPPSPTSSTLPSPTDSTDPLPPSPLMDAPIDTNATTTGNVWVDEHNRIRADVGQSPIAWNQQIADRAKKHVNKCKDEHSSDASRKLGKITLGENLAFGSPYKSFSDDEMVKMWEEEKEFYTHPEKPSSSTKGETGHYTQIINKNVTEIGCACSKCGTDDKLCVCQYNPGQFGDVPPY